MAKKRGNNEGSIFKRNDGKWCSQLTVGKNLDGSPKRKYFYGKTRQEVSQKMNKAINSLMTGSFVDSSSITVAEWLHIWLFEYKRNSVRPSTFDSYETLSRVHICPALGIIKLKDLRPEHLQNFYNEKFQSGLSTRTIKYLHTIMHAALKQAIKNNLVVRNVSEATTLPKQKKSEIKILSIQEQTKFINALDGDRLKAAFILALSTGVRQGELLALRWKYVDLVEGTIKIRSNLQRVNNSDPNVPTKTILIFQEPKTQNGNRTIPLPDAIVEILKQHRKSQLEEKLVAGELYENNDLVFATVLGKPIDPKNLVRRFKLLLKQAELDYINFHALRHTYATRLLEINEHPKVVQELMGHSDVRITLDIYSHVMPEIKKEAANKINHLFETNNKQVQ